MSKRQCSLTKINSNFNQQQKKQVDCKIRTPQQNLPHTKSDTKQQSLLLHLSKKHTFIFFSICSYIIRLLFLYKKRQNKTKSISNKSIFFYYYY